LPNFRDEYCQFRHNLIYVQSGDLPRIASLVGVSPKQSWAAWQARGQDQGSILADPRFVSFAHRDWRLQPDSPAFRLGFKPIDLSQVGNYPSPDRRSWPRPEVKVLREPAEYDPRKVTVQCPPRQDYEHYEVGETDRYAHVGEERGLSSVRVTEETAASGRRSLKFTDAAGQKHIFTPYVTYPLRVTRGWLQAGFDLRLEPGAMFAYEWRDDPYHYNLGPSLHVDAEGWLTANGKRLIQLPHGCWIRFDVVGGLGPQANGRYRLTIKLPGRLPLIYRDLACSPQFTTLECVTIFSPADGPAVFYLDNVDFRRRGGK
jgi:hypothetical protein